MRIIPVVDLRKGIVVRAVGGRRNEYQPLTSKLTSAVDLPSVAKALIAATHGSELYIADLDAIEGTGNHFDEILQFAGMIQTIWLDPGVRGRADLNKFTDPAIRLVLGSETIIDESIFGELPQDWAFSIDLRDGQTLGSLLGTLPIEIAERAITFGARTLILLDLAAVGERCGPIVGELCCEIRTRFPEIEILCGGGVRNQDDLRLLEDSGASGVLVASALHDGSLNFSSR